MKLEEGGLSSSPGVVLYPAYCLINHACRWTQLEQSYNQISVVSTYLQFFPLGLIWGLCTVLVCDWLVQQQHQLPEAAWPELGAEVPGADQEGGGDLNKVSHVPTNLANQRNFSPSLLSKVRFLNCWQLSTKEGHRQVLVLQVSDKNSSNSKLQNLFKFSVSPAATVHGAVILLSWAPTCEDSLKKNIKIPHVRNKKLIMFKKIKISKKNCRKTGQEPSFSS